MQSNSLPPKKTAGPFPDLPENLQQKSHVVVIGAGISGLASAWFLEQKGFSVTVLEAGNQVGGNLQTVQQNGCLWERGPNSFINNRQAMAQLIAQLDLGSSIVLANQSAHKRFIGKKGKVIALPGSLKEALTTPVISVFAKLRLLIEPLIRRVSKEESIADYVTRRLGQEVMDWMIDPFISGVFAGDPKRLSADAAVPKIKALETEHGSMILGGIAKMKAKAAEKNLETKPSAIKLDGAMMSFDKGIHALPNAIAQKLGDSIILNTQVDGLTFSPEFGYQVRSGDQIWQAQEVILAVPSAQVARIIDDLAWPNDDLMDKAVKALRDIEYPAVASITMAFYKDQIQHPLDGFGCLLPSKERQKTLGVLFPSSIFANRCPDDQHLMTVFIGGARGADVMTMTPEQRVQIILKELSAYLGIVGEPLWYEESLWPKAIPQYNLGHLARMEQVENALSQFPGLHLRSNWRDGVAVGDCVEQAFALANKLNPADTPSAI